jgi:hypothetical protein
MSNPRVLPSEASFNHYMMMDDVAWMGACHLYDHVSPFLFGEDPDNVPRSSPSSQEIRHRLSLLNGDTWRVLMKFLESVRARAVRDIAINLCEEFVQ